MKIINKKIVLFLSLIVSLIFNCSVLGMLGIQRNLFFVMELFAFFQFLGFNFLVFLLLEKVKKTFLALSTFLFYIYFALIAYHLIFGTSLDYSFFALNIRNLPYLIPAYWHYFVLVLVASIANAFFFSEVFYKINERKNRRLIFLACTISLFFTPYLTGYQNLNNSLFNFLGTINRRDNIISIYEMYRKDLIEKNISQREKLIEVNKKNSPSYLDNVVIINIESLNNNLVNKKITPNFIELAKEGTLLPYFYSNSVQTILAEENILCGLPSSFNLDLYKNGDDKKLFCLPEFFKKLGYKTFFLKSFNLQFENTGEFMKDIGFDEVQADNLMQKDDPRYLWGFREDFFYKRAFEYLASSTKSKGNFIYLQSGPTNHWSFEIPADINFKVPYENPKTFKEKISNTTFIQDYYLPVAWQELNKLFPQKNYTLIIVGDHSWPIGIHLTEKDGQKLPNIFNENGAWEENFLTSAILIVGNEESFKNKVNPYNYSSIDIFPSIVSAFGYQLENSKFQQSIFENKPKGYNLTIQPFGNRYINFYQGNQKYQYNASTKSFIIFDLAIDPEEKNGKILSTKKSDNLKIISKNLLNL